MIYNIQGIYKNFEDFTNDLSEEEKTFDYTEEETEYLTKKDVITCNKKQGFDGKKCIPCKFGSKSPKGPHTETCKCIKEFGRKMNSPTIQEDGSHCAPCQDNQYKGHVGNEYCKDKDPCGLGFGVLNIASFKNNTKCYKCVKPNEYSVIDSFTKKCAVLSKSDEKEVKIITKDGINIGVECAPGYKKKDNISLYDRNGIYRSGVCLSNEKIKRNLEIIKNLPLQNNNPFDFIIKLITFASIIIVVFFVFLIYKILF